MFNLIENNKVYAGIISVVIVIILYYLIDYQIKSTLKQEIKKMQIKKYKRAKHAKMIKNKKNASSARRVEETEQQMDQQGDIDSYMDPAEGYDDNAGNNEKLTKDNMLMRDLVDGMR